MKLLFLATAAVMAALNSTAAMARVDVDISIGGPDVILGGPGFYYPPVRYVERPRIIILPERIYRPGPVYRARHYGDEYRARRYYDARQYYSRPGQYYGYRGPHYRYRGLPGGYRNGWHN